MLAPLVAAPSPAGRLASKTPGDLSRFAPAGQAAGAGEV